MGLQTVANQFLNMEQLEHGVAKRCKSDSKYGTIEKKKKKKVEIKKIKWRRGEVGLQTVAYQFLNMEPLEHGIANR